MTLSSSIPFMMAHFTKSSVGLFWHNAADGWIDVKKGGQGWRRPAGGHLLDVRDVGPVCDAWPWPQSCFHTGRAPHLTVKSLVWGDCLYGAYKVFRGPVSRILLVR